MLFFRAACLVQCLTPQSLYRICPEDQYTDVWKEGKRVPPILLPNHSDGRVFLGDPRTGDSVNRGDIGWATDSEVSLDHRYPAELIFP